MDENKKTIFSHSEKVIANLKLLSLFFEDEHILKIYIRTQVIHKLFLSNSELDTHKLELFHLQYTETIIELLKKVKQNNEKLMLHVTDEINVNQELIKNLNDSMQLEHSFDHAKTAQTIKIGKALNTLYKNLSDYAKDIPFPKTIRDFSNTYAKDFFYEVSPELMQSLLDYDPDKLYRNGYAAIEKKLMGLQCKHHFKNHFYCGLRSKREVVEVYRLADFIVEDDDNEYFVFDPERNILLGCEPGKLKGIEIISNISKKAKIVFDLNEKNARLKNSLPVIKTTLPEEVVKLLTEYQRRIEDINFLDLIDDFDIQANILKTMLNTRSI
ncbi:MAG: hypothetical protein ACXWCZ_14540, partial [Flavisolibacter sp.]